MATKKTTTKDTDTQEEVKETVAQETNKKEKKATAFICIESGQVKRGNKIFTVFVGQIISLLPTDEYKESCFKEVE